MSDIILPEPKVCNTCGIFKQITEFHRNKSSKGGHLPRCKECRKLADAAYIESHREVTRIRALEWSKKNPEKAAKRAKQWRSANPERCREFSAKYRRSDRGKAATERWLKIRDPRRRQAAARRYYLKNLERYRGYARNRRATQRGASGRHTKDDIAAIAKSQRWRCIYCPASIKRAYNADHIMPLALGGSNDKTNIQLLCPRCNKSKGAKHPIQFAMSRGMLL
jgi:5-methylcytosine-specific restriction endonuclease McrA